MSAYPQSPHHKKAKAPAAAEAFVFQLTTDK
jgi:hypothetical protein